MDKLEKAERVIEKTGVTFEEARAALEASNYDVLDAIVYLECLGKTSAGAASYTTASGQGGASDEMAQAQVDYERDTKTPDFGKVFERLLAWVRKVLKASVDTSFVVERKGSKVISMPLLLLVLLGVLAFWVVIPLLVVGLFCNFKYRFEGIGAVTFDVNELVDKAADAAENLKKDVMSGVDDGKGDDGAAR